MVPTFLDLSQAVTTLRPDRQRRSTHVTGSAHEDRRIRPGGAHVKIRLALAAALVAIAVGAAAALAGGNGPQRYTIGLIGDVPYGPQGRAEYPALLASMNDAKLAFSLFDGDLKNGSDRCDDSLYTTAIAAFDSLERPLVWVPGDNDWTDCHRASNGGYDPIERLNHERALFASTDQSLGEKTLTLTRELPSYPENWRFQYGPVVYAGLNVQGSNDNFPHAGVDGEPIDRGADPAAEIAREDAEHLARERANIQWLKDTFAEAKTADASAVLVVWQGDPNFNNELALKDPRSYDGFAGVVNELRAETLAFAGQVVLVHGDSHYFKVDKPLSSPSGKVLANFTRVETFGSKNTQWVTADVDPKDPNVFTFRPQIVAANAG
jgi:hypothetical protein